MTIVKVYYGWKNGTWGTIEIEHEVWNHLPSLHAHCIELAKQKMIDDGFNMKDIAFVGIL